ncbi:hypothetical protein [Acuticoccus yangtzensis]|uniref:hypothetical protein n=1 Tax=Acuticoccus yangtzensis TaxID=1443441 RepID=UPI0009497986|nr:hypothetical protein [Acuticoccus yangtzensis]ORE94440.1 hypothetical protein ATO13_10211 [Stappia sp. 22II-S9-Z10]
MPARRSTRRWLDLGLTTPVLLAALTLSGAATEPRWFIKNDPAGHVAMWGVPSTEAVGFVVTCGGTRTIVLSPALYAMDEPQGPSRIRFTVDEMSYVRAANLVFSERDAAWQASAVVPADDDILTAFRRGRSLTYDFDPPRRAGDAFTVSLDGSAAPLDDVISGC